MKVLFITAVRGISGSEIVLVRLLRWNRDIEPLILLPQGPLQLQLERERHRVYLSKGLGKLHRSGNPFWPLSFVLRWLLSGIEILRVCRKERPEIIQASHFAAAIYAALPARLLGIPLVWHIHDIISTGTLGAGVCLFLGKRVAKVVAVSEAVRRSLVCNGVPTTQIVVVHNGIDSKKEFNPDSMVRGTLRKKYHLGADVLLIGFIGVIVQWKGIHVFLDAIQQLQEEVHRPARFFVIGDSWNQTDPYKQSLLARVEAAGLNHLVHFTGRLSNIPELLADLDLVVHASIEPDPFPNVILEAMAMRKLIIASNCGGVPEMLDHGVTGFLYPPGDVGALRGLLSRCIHEYENLTAHRECARRTVEEYFTEESQWAALLGIYHGLVRSSSQVGTR